MGKSVLVFISHSSDDKKDFIEPIVKDLEDSYINVWFDKRKILPGDNLRKSIFRDGLDKADVALIFFTKKSLESRWVDKEIKHVLREEGKKGNDFDLNKIISIFDSEETYKSISNRYPELTDDLLHLMPKTYDKIQLGQLISAIWSKYLSLQGGDIETQKQLLSKEREIFHKDKEIQDLTNKLNEQIAQNPSALDDLEYDKLYSSGKTDNFLEHKEEFLSTEWVEMSKIKNVSEAIAFGLLSSSREHVGITEKGKDFIKWVYLHI